VTRFHVVLLAAFVALDCAAFGAHGQPSATPQYVSMLQLIANPNQFNGSLICVTGFLTMEHEGDLLFLHQEDAEHMILENAIRIDETKQMRADAEQIDGKYVRITGVFLITDRRRYPFFGGGIGKLRSYQVWSDPRKPVSRKVLEMPGVVR
jgi:hypothetical protein